MKKHTISERFAPLLKGLNSDSKIVIGIDCGVKTGFAIWDCTTQKLLVVTSMKIIEAIDMIRYINNYLLIDIVCVRVENPNLRTYYGRNPNAKKQGAGSVKRDYSIWKEFLGLEKLNMIPIAPQAIRTKIKSIPFKELTGWEGMTNEHARDAAMMVFNCKVQSS